MREYKKLNDFNINRFDNLFGCFNNLCSLSMGYLFPQCLFGRIYELSGHGECFLGCCKIWSIQMCVNLLFSGICTIPYKLCPTEFLKVMTFFIYLFCVYIIQ